MEAQLEQAKIDEAENDPEAAAREAEALARKERQREEAQRLPAETRNTIIAEVERNFNSGDDSKTKIKEMVEKYK